LEARSKTTSALNVALLGYGFASKTFHAPLLTNVPGLRLTHIVSSDSAKVKKDYDVTVLANAEEAFALPEIDLIVIATPNTTHFDFAGKALNAGKHVVVDKPFTNTFAEAMELVTLAKSCRRLLSVFQDRRWDSDFLTVRQVVASGALGEVAHLDSPDDRNHPEPRQSCHELPGPGSGIWFDLGPHLVDQALQLFGPPEAVYADLEMQRARGQAVDYFHVILRYGRNRVIVHGASLVAAETPRFAIHGALGSYTKFGMDPQEEALKRGEIPGTPGWGQDEQVGTLITKKGDGFDKRQVPNVAGNYLAYYEGIRDAISLGAPNPVTPDQALAVINVLETGVASSAARAELPFSPIKL
jgi:predicted dehydrogenase